MKRDRFFTPPYRPLLNLEGEIIGRLTTQQQTIASSWSFQILLNLYKFDYQNQKPTARKRFVELKKMLENPSNLSEEPNTSHLDEDNQFGI